MGIITIAFPIWFTIYNRKIFKMLHIFWVGAGKLMGYLIRFNICKRVFEVIKLLLRLVSMVFLSHCYRFWAMIFVFLKIRGFYSDLESVKSWTMETSLRNPRYCFIRMGFFELSVLLWLFKQITDTGNSYFDAEFIYETFECNGVTIVGEWGRWMGGWWVFVGMMCLLSFLYEKLYFV